MSNVQLPSKEAVRVFIEIETDRILGFAPENANLLGAAGIRWKSYTLLHAAEIERWVKKYRIQQEQDAYEATILTMKREERFRKAIRSAIQQRNQHVNQFNRDLNNTLLRLMDERYDRIMKACLAPVVHGMAEAYDAGKSPADVAMESPAYSKPSGIDHVTGERVDPRVN